MDKGATRMYIICAAQISLHITGDEDKQLCCLWVHRIQEPEKWTQHFRFSAKQTVIVYAVFW